MAENSKIQWTHHTFNHIRGCQKVAAGCLHCYAETLSNRNPGVLGVWGPNGTRIIASEDMWKQPVKWDKMSLARMCLTCKGRRQVPVLCSDFSGGEPRQSTKQLLCVDCHGTGHDQSSRNHRVFCASLADVFEQWDGPITDSSGDYIYCDSDGTNWNGMAHHPDDAEDQLNPRRTRSLTLDDVRARLFRLIDATPNLDWLLLTKRPENVRRMMPAVVHEVTRGGERVGEILRTHYQNVWLGTSVAEQVDADRNIPELLKCRELASVLFLSVEPLIGPVDLSRWLGGRSCRGHGNDQELIEQCETGCDYDPPQVDWVIIGGESGPHARPCHVDWIRSIIRQCRDAGCPVFVKQLGDNAMIDPDELQSMRSRPDYKPLHADKGSDPSEWPEDLRVREFPRSAVSHV